MRNCALRVLALTCVLLVSIFFTSCEKILPRFVVVEGGTFSMGNDSGDPDEKPVHNVTLTSFYMSRYEVTQEEWIAVMGSNSSSFTNNPANKENQLSRPVEQVSWYDAILYCNTRSSKEGLTPCYSLNGTTNPVMWGPSPLESRNSQWDGISCDMAANGYRLPTEAEWEYAARGGKKSKNYSYSGLNTIDSVAWYEDNSNQRTHEIGKKKANELGIYDMTGNVWEWCFDKYGEYTKNPVNNPISGFNPGKERVLRGGSWASNSWACSLTNRSTRNPTDRVNSVGFRVVKRY
ncbi:MAG: SUMF1/EgtB/PvdO family nonheme iron enzyme [Spirochaetaceae bacterium]|jgi:formylglycine-generating enzyme required for sulfatase activity|nr:SUMF1/EgtB/PvdO family nonheme iron enzyme [Spirochaetaceae bacterium]